ncbi:hypothetical protein M413DRAFT_444788 [Hebeloma cylindrosporum]|uniref:DUF6534 domain-containing protein n=1 Tax=Hebeloma cylindrosporum TaxID=76867 RepID=A0A0C3CDS2_HEBCY|nr:hypothetical protein M413DRAFT_444788 [Hebeloma cylindrosporum h7]
MVEPTLGNTIGAASHSLFGASSMQVFMYYTHFKNDWRLQKCFDGLISVIHLAFAIHCVYFYVITSFGHIGALNYVFWSFKVQAALHVLTVITVQDLYAWRVRTLGKHFSHIWPWVVVAIVAVGWGECLTERWDQVAKFHWVLFTSFILATLIDFVIATTLCYYLNKSRSIFSETNNRLLKIIHYVLACGFLTSACSLGALISVATMPKTLVFIGIDFLLPRMYMFSYMSMLNARKTTSEKDTSSFNVTGALNQFRSGNSGWADQKPTVTMDTEIISEHDQDSIPLASSHYYPGGKPSQQASYGHHKSKIGVTVHRTENRHYDTV